jgi:tRNA pseudouridine55 synthase
MISNDNVSSSAFIYKDAGLTPLQAIEKYRIVKNLGNVPMTYAGRLDPMAEGVLLVLWGAACKEKDTYLGKGKEYRFEVLFGVSTDTYDALGLVKNVSATVEISAEELKKEYTCNDPQTFSQSYPMYSSKPVDGKPLFVHAREGGEVDIPAKDVTIYSLQYVSSKNISGKDVLRDVTDRVSQVDGDFRQNEILQTWKEKISPKDVFVLATFTARVSSGTYIRSLAEQMGERFGTGAIAYRIIRPKIG